MREQNEVRHQPEKLMSFEESLQVAKDLVAKYGDQMTAYAYEKDPYGRHLTPFMLKISDDIKRHYFGHGITRGGLEGDIATAINILANKTMKGTSGKLKGSEPYNAWTSGHFLVISFPDQPIALLDENRNAIHNEIGMKINAKALIVDPTIYPLINELQSRFPEVDIVPADRANEYLSKSLDLKK